MLLAEKPRLRAAIASKTESGTEAMQTIGFAMQDASLRRFCASLPKAELHAHLHGSARLSTIVALAPPSARTTLHRLQQLDSRSLEECFAAFGAIHQTVTKLSAVRRITADVLGAFAADGVRYLELRTTPRPLDDADAEGYVRAVLAVFAEHEGSARARASRTAEWVLRPRLLLSVDRSGSPEQALRTVELAARLRATVHGADLRLLGVDFSGNPNRAGFADFAPAFAAARKHGLRVAAHVAEVDAPLDTAAVLAFRPERLGHALLLSDAQASALETSPIPIELCPTSNCMTLGLANLGSHPTLRRWLGGAYPVSINTDDAGVFNTTLSRELAAVGAACALTPRQLAAVGEAALDHAFESDREHVDALYAIFSATASRLLRSST